MTPNEKLLVRTAGEIARHDPAFAKRVASKMEDVLDEISRALAARDRRKRIRAALETLKRAFDERGGECRIHDADPYQALNALGALLGENPGFGRSS